MVSIKEEEEEEPHKQNHQEEQEEPQMESESSPLRSPHQSHLPPKPKPPFYSKPQILPPQNPQPHTHENLSQIIAKDRRIHGFSPLRSPSPDNNKPLQPLPPLQLPPQEPTPSNSIQLNPLSPVIFVNRSIREELSVVSKMDPAENGIPPPARPTHPTHPTHPSTTSATSAAPPPSGGGRTSGVDLESGGADRKSRTVSSILWRERREAMLKRAALGFRVCAFVFCLISFSVMAADKTQGWAGDSFDRYKEYRYCLSINVIGFVYAGSQAADLSYNIITGLHSTQSHMRYGIDFFLDQILAYLIISASSAAASRVDDWVSNWGKDDFTVMASASIGMSFLSFVAFAFSSLISGYNLCTRSHT